MCVRNLYVPLAAGMAVAPAFVVQGSGHLLVSNLIWGLFATVAGLTGCGIGHTGSAPAIGRWI
jgi:hypothetical protein